LAENIDGSRGIEGSIGCTDSYQPISVITSAQGCGQLALGYLRNIYAVCGSSIKIFTHDASGNVPSASGAQRFSGSITKLNHPFGTCEGK
jgi:hypothetical protein